MDAHANFAYSTLAASATSAATALTVTTGQGALFPTPPFNCTLWPTSVQPLSTNAEIVRVTAISGDVLTVTRAQEGTTALSAASGAQIANTITKKVLTDIETATTTVRIPIQLRNPIEAASAGNSFWTTSALTDWEMARWEFLANVQGKVYGIVFVPHNLAATPNAKIKLVIAANATTGVTRLNVATAATADGGTLDPAALTNETAQDITVPGTAYFRKDVSFTLTNPPVADDLMIVEVLHEGDHANDTLAVNTLILAALLEVSVNVF